MSRLSRIGQSSTVSSATQHTHTHTHTVLPAAIPSQIQEPPTTTCPLHPEWLQAIPGFPRCNLHRLPTYLMQCRVITKRNPHRRVIANPEAQRLVDSMFEVRRSKIPNRGDGVFAKYCIPLDAKSQAARDNLRFASSQQDVNIAPSELASSSSSSSSTTTHEHIFGGYAGPVFDDVHSLTPEQLRYSYQLHSGGVVVAPSGYWVGKINHSYIQPNVAFAKDGSVKQIADIRAGDELLWDYGPSYWLDMLVTSDSIAADNTDITPGMWQQWRQIYQGTEDYSCYLEAQEAVKQLPLKYRIPYLYAIFQQRNPQGL